MEDEKELFIKNELKKDILISKKAEDTFNRFFYTTINDLKIKDIEEQPVETYQEDYENKIENVVDINQARHKRSFGRKFLSAVASFAIIFVVTNVYATTKGYENIFFMIRNLIQHEEFTDKEEILLDKDITISYKSIPIADGVELQINKLIVSENEAKLVLTINEDEKAAIHPRRFIVYDITDENVVVIGNQEIQIDDKETMYSKEINLNGIKNSTKKLKLEIKDESNSEIVSLEIDLDNKEIDVTSSMILEIQKLSEVELKEVLAKYVALNVSQDLDGERATEKVRNTQKILLAMELISNEKKSKYKLEDINKAIFEFSNEKYTDELDITDDIIYYDKNDKSYKFYPGDYNLNPLCLNIENISFSNGIYTITLDYCYPSELDWLEGTIEDLDIFRTVLKFKLNNDYEYTKYCLLEIDNIESEKLEK